MAQSEKRKESGGGRKEGKRDNVKCHSAALTVELRPDFLKKKNVVGKLPSHKGRAVNKKMKKKERVSDLDKVKMRLLVIFELEDYQVREISFTLDRVANE